MSEINFVPMCSNCQSIIFDEEVSVRTIHNYVGQANGKFLDIPETLVCPAICPCCGSVFTSLSMPIKFPVIVRRRPGYYGEAT